VSKLSGSGTVLAAIALEAIGAWIAKSVFRAQRVMNGRGGIQALSLEQVYSLVDAPARAGFQWQHTRLTKPDHKITRQRTRFERTMPSRQPQSSGAGGDAGYV
jgi:hypothetical protein